MRSFGEEQTAEIAVQTHGNGQNDDDTDWIQANQADTSMFMPTSSEEEDFRDSTVGASGSGIEAVPQTMCLSDLEARHKRERYLVPSCDSTATDRQDGEGLGESERSGDASQTFAASRNCDMLAQKPTLEGGADPSTTKAKAGAQAPDGGGDDDGDGSGVTSLVVRVHAAPTHSRHDGSIPEPNPSDGADVDDTNPTPSLMMMRKGEGVISFDSQPDFSERGDKGISTADSGKAAQQSVPQVVPAEYEVPSGSRPSPP